MIVYQCEDSLESIFTAIYRAYEEHRNHEDTGISLADERVLFAEYIPVTVDVEKAAKVIRTLKRRFGEVDYQSVCLALTAPHPDKAQAVYRMIVKALAGNVAAGHLFDNLSDQDCSRVFFLSRSAGRENHHLCGFLRFEEIQGGILYGKIAPKNNLITFLVPHFADRFPMENFIIHDIQRNLLALHPAGRDWFLASVDDFYLEQDKLKITEAEQEVQALFTHFCRTIAIKERENKKLQQNMLPLRFRSLMTEFDP